MQEGRRLMLGFGGSEKTLLKATAAVVAARGALQEAEARRAAVRERLASAPVEALEDLATEAARAEALVAAHRQRVEAAAAVKATAEAEATEERAREAEAQAVESARRVRELGAEMSARARAFAVELVALGRELEAEAAKGRAAKFSIPRGERQDRTPDASGASPWHGALYGEAAEVFKAACFVLQRGG
jgi:hypothetical protein